MSSPLRILLIDDDEHTFVITRELLTTISGRAVELDWASEAADGLAGILSGQHDIYLLDYRLGPDDGIEVLSRAREAGCRDLILLKCTSSYPAAPVDMNLLTIPDLRDRFDCEVGLSDHTLGIGVALAAIGLGASVIEKHLTLARGDGGVDSSFSMEPAEMAQLVAEAERAWLARGRVTYAATGAEQASFQFRRSLYVVKDLKAGEPLTHDNVRAIRPGFGLAPKLLEEVVGRRAAGDIVKGTPLTWTMLS